MSPSTPSLPSGLFHDHLFLIHYIITIYHFTF
jgi:hypothetical protein